MVRILFFLVLSCVMLVTPLWGANDQKQLLESELRQMSGEKVEIVNHRVTGKARLLHFIGGFPVTSSQVMGKAAVAGPEEAAKAFLSRYGVLFGVADPSRDLKVKRIVPEKGRKFIRYQQSYSGLPVIGGELIVQVDGDSTIMNAMGKTSLVTSLETAPAVISSDARETALGLVAVNHGVEKQSLMAIEPVLSVYNPAILGHNQDANYLVWHLEIKSIDGAPIREFVLIDAQSGRVLLNFNQIDFAKYRTIYDKGNVPSDTLPGTLRRSEGQAATGDDEVDSVYDYLGDAYDFYNNMFGRDSVNGSGLPLKGTVRFVPAGETAPYNNAYWDSNVSQMVCGITQCTDDTVGHELTHGVDVYTSNLFYYMQSGAISESLADTMGEFIDLVNGKGNDGALQRWLFSEDSGTIRNMKNPILFGDPDKMTSPHYRCGDNDQGGVHSNSGVNNKAVYLMTDGDSFNGKSVTGIGITKVAKIYYDTMTNLLVSASDYADLYSSLQISCNNLISSGVTTAFDCQQVKNALDAVEMGSQPSSCQSPHALLCPTGSTPANIFFDDFESGSSKWQLTVVQGNDPWSDATGSLVNHTPYATSGTGHLWGADDEILSDSFVATAASIAIPAGALLHFNHAFSFEFDADGYYDGGVVEYSQDSGATWSDVPFTENGYGHTIHPGSSNPLHGRSTFSGLSNGYISSKADLSQLAGKNVRFRFRIGTDSNTGDKGWYIDDVRIYTCNTTPRTLSVTVMGNGSVNSLPSGIACTGSGPGCTAQFSVGAQVRLTATESAWSDFSGWGGSCSGSAHDCFLTLSSDASVTAGFTTVSPVQLLTATAITSHPTMADAYAAAASGSDVTMKVMAGDFAESLLFDKAVSVKFSGGQNGSFTETSGLSVLQGKLTIRNGRLTVRDLRVR